MLDESPVPPSDKDLERCVLGEMMFDSEALDIVIENVVEEAFYNPAHKVIFDVMKNLRLKNMPVDQLTITEELRKTGNLEIVGGEMEIASISEKYFSAANIRAHIDILNEKARRRKLISLMIATKSLCYEDAYESGEIVTLLQIQMDAIFDVSKNISYRKMPEIIRDAYDWIFRKTDQKGTMGIPTGLAMLDKYTDGWLPGRLYLLAGKTGYGKSSLATNSFALTAAKKGTSTGIFSLEMGDIEIGVRLISSAARFDVSDIQYKHPSQDEWEKISSVCNSLYSIPIFVDETPGIAIGQIGSKIRIMQRNDGVKLVVVDYLQLMEGKSTKTREQEVSTVSRGLKLLSKSLHIPIIAISQFSRKADESEAAEPQLSWLRESGALEQDADTVIFIHDAPDKVKKEYKMSGDKKDVREIIIRKNRGGKTGKFYALWKPDHLTFYDIDY